MKTPFVVAIVVMLHVAAVGGIILIQGCGTTSVSEPNFETYEMPNTTPEPPVRPVVVPPRPEVTPGQPVAPKWPEKTKLYVVKKGDSLSVIAKRHGVTTPDIMRLNGLTNPNRIFVGQKLVLPGYVQASEPSPGPSVSNPAPNPAPVSGGGTYVIQRGDSLSVIAKRHGTTVSALRQLNGIKGDRIIAGQKLKIPGRGISTPSPSPSPVSTPVETQPVEVPTIPPLPDVAPPAPPAVPSPADDIPGQVTPPDAPDSLFPEPPDVTPDVLIEDEAVSEALIHVVKEGEDIYSIARIYGVLASEISNLNNINSEEVSPGQKLKIP